MKKIKRASLPRRIAWAFVMMSIIPMVLAVSFIFIVTSPTITGRIEEVRIGVFWIIISSIIGYFIVRNVVKTVVQITEHAKDVADGDFSKRLHLDEDSEIGELARSFNKITKELENKVRELEVARDLVQSIFHKIGEAMTLPRGMESLLELILQSTADTLKSRGGFIMLLNSAGDELEPAVVFAEDRKPLKLTNVKFGEGIIGKAVKENKPVAVSVSKDRTATGADGDYKNLLCVPLDYKNQPIGIIAMYDKKEAGAFQEADMDLLEDIASQSALAISNFQLNADIEKAYLDTVRVLAMAVEAKDAYSGGHLDRVAKYATDIGRKLGLDEETMKILHDGAYLHDLGKIGIRDSILTKTGRLSPEEFEEMKKHPVIGETIIKPVKSMSKICGLVRYHQERWDGSGYPDGLKGEEIPLTACILAVADIYDALTTERPYKKALNREESIEEMKKLAGTKLDKKVVDAFLETI